MDKRIVASFLNPMEPVPTRLTMEGSLQMPVKCLVCDIYGTLLISGSGDIGIARQQAHEEEALTGLVHEFGVQGSPSDLRKRLYDAIEREHQRKKAIGIEHPEVEIDKIWATILPFDEMEKIQSFAIRWEMVVNPVWPMPGLSELIGTCRNGGIALGIISNAQFFTAPLFTWLLDQDLERLGFDRSLTMLSFQHGCAKPSGVLFTTVVDRLKAMGIPAERAAFIGNDMRNDIAPAQRVGFQTVLFAGDARSLRLRANKAECRNIRPDLQITHLSQLANWLAKPPMKTNLKPQGS